MLDMKYFVLKPKGNDLFAIASREAMRAYANVIEETDIQLAESLRAWAKLEEENASTEIIEIDLDDKIFNYIAKTAHELDITINECANLILKDYIEDIEFDSSLTEEDLDENS